MGQSNLISIQLRLLLWVLYFKRKEIPEHLLERSFFSALHDPWAVLLWNPSKKREGREKQPDTWWNSQNTPQTPPRTKRPNFCSHQRGCELPDLCGQQQTALLQGGPSLLLSGICASCFWQEFTDRPSQALRAGKHRPNTLALFERRSPKLKLKGHDWPPRAFRDKLTESLIWNSRLPQAVRWRIWEEKCHRDHFSSWETQVWGKNCVQGELTLAAMIAFCKWTLKNYIRVIICSWLDDDCHDQKWRNKLHPGCTAVYTSGLRFSSSRQISGYLVLLKTSMKAFGPCRKFDIWFCP